MSGLDRDATIAIVGAGLAGSRCAVALRRHGHTGPIVLHGDEACGAYERPALSKGFLDGTRTTSQLTVPGTDPRALAAVDIELELGSEVVALNGNGTELELANGARQSVDAVVLATGAAPRRLTDGGTTPRVHVLRSLADAERLRAAVRPGMRLVIVGSGFVGSEVASTMVGLGVRATILEAEELPLARRIGVDAAQWLVERWRRAGVQLRCGITVDAVVDDPVRSDVTVHTSLGAFTADHVLLAVGTTARDGIFHRAFPGRGSAGRGIPVDHAGRTGVPGVWALGDVACRVDALHGTVARFEHWTDAAVQAERVARDITGAAQGALAAPYAWSDQFGVRLQVAGSVSGAHEAHVDGASADSLLVRYVDGSGALLGMFGAGHPAQIAACRTALAR